VLTIEYIIHMRRIRLTVIFPGAGNIISSIVRKFLDFSDYKYQKSLVSRLDLTQEFQLVSSYDTNRVRSYICEIAQILFENSKYDPEVLELVGTRNDGSYVTTKQSCIENKWISVGIGSHFEFEQELFSRGNLVHGFDAQIGIVPKQSRGIRMTRKNWGFQNSDSTMTLKAMLVESGIDANEEWNLKFDIEGAEWNLLSQIHSLEKLPNVIICELHNLIPRLNDQSLNLRLKELSKLNALYEPVFVKPNNYSAYVMSEGIGFYDVLEITWVLRSETANMKKKKLIATSELVVINDKLRPMYPIGFLALN
jgi:hypothetical protein